MLRLPLVISVLLLALTVGSSTTFAKGNGGKVDNVAATRAYLLARQRLMQAGEHGQQAGEAAVQSLVARVKTECSGVLAEAPENRAREDIRDEIVEEVPLTLERPARNATLAFASTVQRLHWSNGARGERFDRLHRKPGGQGQGSGAVLRRLCGTVTTRLRLRRSDRSI